ncbi:hypothetical protein [Pseudobacillus badius]|uniref:hypothetical protein n=1 Tax=Bacillus badius TaxID=1455 RepID=UPI0007B3719F|nr:hypothetical protein [Bacillus badius]KZR57901.1 hypothetical protein A3781_19180 [Bacillus badius]
MGKIAIRVARLVLFTITALIVCGLLWLLETYQLATFKEFVLFMLSFLFADTIINESRIDELKKKVDNQ